MTLVADSNSTIISSPFVNAPPQSTPTQPPPANSAPLNLELRGVSRVGDKFEFSFYDTRTRASYWIAQNDTTNPDISILSYNSAGTSVVVNARGREEQLSLKAPSAQTMALAPATAPEIVYSPFGGDNRGANQYGGYPIPVVVPAGVPVIPVNRGPSLPGAIQNSRGSVPVINQNGPGNAGVSPGNRPSAGTPGGYRGGDTITSNISYTLGGTFIGRPIIQP
jgi:hypothetical protein